MQTVYLALQSLEVGLDAQSTDLTSAASAGAADTSTAAAKATSETRAPAFCTFCLACTKREGDFTVRTRSDGSRKRAGAISSVNAAIKKR